MNEVGSAPHRPPFTASFGTVSFTIECMSMLGPPGGDTPLTGIASPKIARQSTEIACSAPPGISSVMNSTPVPVTIFIDGGAFSPKLGSTLKAIGPVIEIAVLDKGANVTAFAAGG